MRGGWVLAWAVAVAGCSDGGSGGGAKTRSVDFGAQAQRLYDQRCAACHGGSGKGDAPGGATLRPRPQNFTDPAWQAGVTDEEIEQAIVGGGQAVGKSTLMPPNPDLRQDPELVKALRAIVRGFGAK